MAAQAGTTPPGRGSEPSMLQPRWIDVASCTGYLLQPANSVVLHLKLGRCVLPAWSARFAL